MATPSVGTLWSIASELGLSIADLFEIESSDGGQGPPAEQGVPPGPTPLQPQETRKSITLAGGVRWERLTAGSDEEIDFVYCVYPVGAASSEEDSPNHHGGREYGYVVSGTLGVRIGFDEYIVRTNDSISFDSSRPHRLWAIGDQPVGAIWIVINRRGDARAKAFR